MASLKQQQYRRLMKEQKATSSKKKVDHPLARYNSLGQINCVVCNVQVKSELLWSTHVQSRKHKDTVALLKSQKGPSSSNTVQSQPAAKIPSTPTPSEFVKPSVPLAKRKAPTPEDSDVPSPKKAKTESKSSKSKKKENTRKTPDSSVVSGLPSDFFDAGVSKKFKGHGEEDYGSDDSDDDVPVASSSSSNSHAQSSEGGKEDSTSKDQNNMKGDSKNGHAPKDSLPEGFFDDPKLDAKARKVEYKDPITEEWEKFQKSIQKEDDVSEALLVEGDEESKEEREHVEVKEQVFWFTKAEELRVKQEQMLLKRQHQATEPTSTPMDTENNNNADNNSSDEELDFDEFLDWRAKMS